jgi:hypothetical protein
MANLDAILKITAKGDASGLAGLNAGIRGIEKAGMEANKALGGLGGILGSVTGGVLALGAGLSAAGVAAFAKGAIDAADNMRDLSQKTGVSVENLSRFQQAAEKSGTTVEGVGNAMVRLSRGMAEAAATGKGPASEALQTLGISAVDASGKLQNADAVMLQVAERFQQIPDGAQKAALAVQLFGRGGAEMIPMLNEGRQAIEGLAATMSTEFANKADAYNDSLAATKAVFGQIGMEIANQLLPYLSSAVDWISKVGIGFRDYIVANREPIRQTIETIAGIGKSLGPWVLGLGVVVGAYKLLTEAVKAAAIAQAALTALSGPAGWAKLLVAAGATTAAVLAINEATKGAGDSTAAAALEAEKLAAKMTGAKTEAEGVAPPIENAKLQQEAFNAAIDQSNAGYQTMLNTINATGQAIDLNQKLSSAANTAELAINNTAKELLKIKLGQATTDSQKMAIIGQIMKLELDGARLQKDAAAAQIKSEVTIADLKRRSAWAELRKADAALATARAMSQGTDAEVRRIAEMERGLAIAKQTANAADREFVAAGNIADQKMRAADAQYNLMVYQARAAAQAAEIQSRNASNQVRSIGNEYLSNTNPAGGSVGGQQYRTRTTAAGGSVSELVPTYAGGGYTGSAPRTGGLDGKGGFMAMLHPRETVIDHTRAGGGRGSSTPTSISIPIQTGPIHRLPDGSDTVSMQDFQAGMQALAAGILGQLATPAGRMALRGA